MSGTTPGTLVGGCQASPNARQPPTRKGRATYIPAYRPMLATKAKSTRIQLVMKREYMTETTPTSTVSVSASAKPRPTGMKSQAAWHLRAIYGHILGKHTHHIDFEHSEAYEKGVSVFLEEDMAELSIPHERLLGATIAILKK